MLCAQEGQCSGGVEQTCPLQLLPTHVLWLLPAGFALRLDSDPGLEACPVPSFLHREFTVLRNQDGPLERRPVLESLGLGPRPTEGLQEAAMQPSARLSFHPQTWEQGSPACTPFTATKLGRVASSTGLARNTPCRYLVTETPVVTGLPQPGPVAALGCCSLVPTRLTKPIHVPCGLLCVATQSRSPKEEPQQRVVLAQLCHCSCHAVLQGPCLPPSCAAMGMVLRGTAVHSLLVPVGPACLPHPGLPRRALAGCCSLPSPERGQVLLPTHQTRPWCGRERVCSSGSCPSTRPRASPD